MMSGMVEPSSVTARELSRRAASVLDRVEHGERLTITRDGEAIAEIIPIDRSRRALNRWVKAGLIATPPPEGYATAAAAAALAPPAPLVSDDGRTVSDVLRDMRDDERS
jgi:prevent-host-death family protein